MRGLETIIIAEHGFFIKYPHKEWVSNKDIDLSWMEKIRPILDEYTDRCSGSMVEEKKSSLVWHYRNADEETVSLRINELKDDLTDIIYKESRLQIIEGDKVLEIKSMLYDKGTAAKGIIDLDKYDFIIAIGDDRTDEDLFSVIPPYGYTIKVGRKPSKAQFNIRDQSQICNILATFSNDKVNEDGCL